jgi:hypothetical protein
MPSSDAEKAVAYAEMELEYRVQLFNRYVPSSGNGCPSYAAVFARFACHACNSDATNGGLSCLNENLHDLVQDDGGMF